VARLKANIPVDADREPPPLRDFKAAIFVPDKINLIAEIKFASPSAGPISDKKDATTIGRMYEKAGSAAVSLITDKRFFQGDPGELPRLKKAISLPILRKDFIIDEVQVREARNYGADAVLLIARILPQQLLKDLICMCREFGITPLTEVHDGPDIDKALACGAEIIGINNRDLDSFKVDIGTTFKLAPLVPDHCILVSESGIENADNIVSLKKTGIHAVLVGTALMRSNDPAGKTEEIVRAGEMRDE
jgi:indole-3-glycerol phosphate synthase